MSKYPFLYRGIGRKLCITRVYVVCAAKKGNSAFTLTLIQPVRNTVTKEVTAILCQLSSGCWFFGIGLIVQVVVVHKNLET